MPGIVYSVIFYGFYHHGKALQSQIIHSAFSWKIQVYIYTYISGQLMILHQPHDFPEISPGSHGTVPKGATERVSME